MRIFKDLDEMYKETERELLHNGLIVQVETVQDKFVKDKDEFKTKELLGYSFLVRETSDRDNWLKNLGKNVDWAEQDFQERIFPARINPGQAHQLRPEWAEFIHDGEFAYTYNERLREQLDETCKLLKEKPLTRQAIITIYDQHYDKKNRSGKARIPCTMYYQFFIREEKLHVIYNIRSNDFYTHFPYDVWHAVALRDNLAKELKIETGDLIYFSGSLHAFKKDNREIF